ncbi:hypothetical protein GOP47_0001111 [Adiantum capillus-veneris]|uniref:Uncharacterized protein n=1 Tax=Adiantum capillus-veneris TaxID=13818 RepID=A0A9D4VGF4_ADICA|nr:hypothetical protein GOP47_0000299 [Adiantum capillus-veneris]KAI5084942.1 hypothetical protein GOP47_0001111 [Adiantum capillus-veneris]
MFATAIRMSSNRFPYIKPALFNTPTQADEAHRLSIVLLAILRRHGPLSVDHCWAQSKEQGFRSKRHMKLVLKWMKDRQQVKVICEHLTELSDLHGDKEFFYAPFDHGREKTDKMDNEKVDSSIQ